MSTPRCEVYVGERGDGQPCDKPAVAEVEQRVYGRSPISCCERHINDVSGGEEDRVHRFGGGQ